MWAKCQKHTQHWHALYALTIMNYYTFLLYYYCNYSFTFSILELNVNDHLKAIYSSLILNILLKYCIYKL